MQNNSKTTNSSQQLLEQEQAFVQQHFKSLCTIIQSSDALRMSAATLRRISRLGCGSKKCIAIIRKIYKHFNS